MWSLNANAQGLRAAIIYSFIRCQSAGVNLLLSSGIQVARSISALPGPLAEGAAVTEGKLFSWKSYKLGRTTPHSFQDYISSFCLYPWNISLVKPDLLLSWMSRSRKFLLPWRLCLGLGPGRDCLWTAVETTSIPTRPCLNVPWESLRGQVWADVLGNRFFFSDLTKIDLKVIGKKRREKSGTSFCSDNIIYAQEFPYQGPLFSPE